MFLAHSVILKLFTFGLAGTARSSSASACRARSPTSRLPPN
jgi:hypothetical protein